MPFRDDDAEELHDWEYPDPEDEEEMHLASTVPCPRCRRFIYEEAERCHHCGNYLSAEELTTNKPWWLVLGVVVLLVTILLLWVLPWRVSWPPRSSPSPPTSVKDPVMSPP